MSALQSPLTMAVVSGLLTLTCGDGSRRSAAGMPADVGRPEAARLYCERIHVNRSRAHAHHLYVDPAGDVYRFRTGETRLPALPKEPTEAALVARYTVGRSSVGAMRGEELARMHAFAEQASRGSYVVMMHVREDPDAISRRCFRLDRPTARYREIPLSHTGGTSGRNQAPEAAALGRWLDSLSHSAAALTNGDSTGGE